MTPSWAHAVGLASDMAIMSLLALSAYLLLVVGRVSFGQQAFFGLGAYASGVMSALYAWPLAAALALGVAVGALCSWALALPTMRLSGLHYAVATLAFGEIARIALNALHWQRPLLSFAFASALETMRSRQTWTRRRREEECKGDESA